MLLQLSLWLKARASRHTWLSPEKLCASQASVPSHRLTLARTATYLLCHHVEDFPPVARRKTRLRCITSLIMSGLWRLKTEKLLRLVCASRAGACRMGQRLNSPAFRQTGRDVGGDCARRSSLFFILHAYVWWYAAAAALSGAGGTGNVCFGLFRRAARAALARQSAAGGVGEYL